MYIPVLESLKEVVRAVVGNSVVGYVVGKRTVEHWHEQLRP